MTNELEIIKRALGMGIGTHGEPCSAGETCQAIAEFREALAAVERLEAQPKTAFCDNQRLWDLLRFCRSDLVHAELINTDEFTVLLNDGEAVARLESYDSMRAKLERLEAERQGDTERLDFLCEAVTAALALFDKGHAIDHFDWAKGTLTGADIRELNDLPGILRRALAKASAQSPANHQACSEGAQGGQS